MKLGTLLSAFACMTLSMGFATPAKAEDPIKIGVYMPLTGQNAFAGQLELEGIQLAHKITPTVLGRPVELVVVDNKSDKVEAANAVKRLTEHEKVLAIIGTYGSSLAMAGGEVAERAKVPVLATSSTNPLVTQGKKYYFRACFIDPYQGEKMANYAVEKLSAKTAAVFYQTGNDYSEGLMNAFVAKAAELGLEIVDTEAFAEGDKDFKAQMTNIAAADPDVVFAPIYYAEAGLAITAARAAGCDAVFMGGDGFGSVKNYASAEDLEGSIYCSGYAPGTDSVKQFEEDYKAAYNVDEIPNMFAPLAYDAAMLLCEGLKAAEEQGLTAGTDEYKQAVIDAIKNMNGTEGITGSYSFDEYNNPIKPVAIIELTGGDEVYQEMY